MIIALIILILGSLIVSAIISPSLYYFLSNYVSGFSFPYSRLFDRVLMVVIFIFLLILKKHFNIKEAIKKFTEISKKCATKDFFVSFFITLSVCIILTLFLDMKDRLVWVPKTTSYYVSKIIKAFFAEIPSYKLLTPKFNSDIFIKIHFLSSNIIIRKRGNKYGNNYRRRNYF